jgi:tripartite-type tricarboxylate transporter receptor subunit TctC
MFRRKFAVSLALVSLCLSWTVSMAPSTSFPSRPVTIVVAFAAGGPADTLARAVVPEFSGNLGQPVLVDNRAGAGGKIAMQTLLRAARDGHTIAYISPSILSIAPLVDKDLGYDPQKDIVPLTTALRGSNVIAVTASLPVKTLNDLVAYGRANRGKLNYGSIGIGSWYHLTTEKLLARLGIEATHVPYKGEAPALADLVAGNVQLMIVSGGGKAMLDEGKVVGIAATGRSAPAYAPRLTPVRDSGIRALADFDETPWIGFGMAAGAPADVVSKLHGGLVKALQSDEVRKRLAAFGEIQTSSSAELQEIIRKELASNRQLIDSGRVKME